MKEKYSKVITESIWLTAVQAINGDCIPPILTCNLVKDIMSFVLNVDKIAFVTAERSTNKVTERIVKKLSHVCSSDICY